MVTNARRSHRLGYAFSVTLTALLCPLGAAAIAAEPTPAAPQVTGAAQSQANAAAARTEQTPPDAPAQSSSLDIIVTAQRRSERLQDVPIAVSAISGDQIAKQGVTRLTDLTATVPSININRNLGATFVYIRGIGNNFLNLGGDSSVAFHENGVYIGRPRAQSTAFIDVDRVEVLRGPQGTLYGRNASGGAINVITKGPSNDLEGNATLSVGNYGYVRFEGGVGGPISGDTITARLAVLGARRDGYGENIVSGRSIDNLAEYGGRLSIKLKASEDFNYIVSGEYYHSDDNHPFHYFGPGKAGAIPTGLLISGEVPSDVRDIASDIDPTGKVNAAGLSGVATWNALSGLTLKAITAYRYSYSHATSDADGTSHPVLGLDQIEKSKQFSQEAQGIYKSGRFGAIGGLYYLHEDLSGGTFVNIPLIGAHLGSGPATGTISAYAAYANLSYEVLDGLTATAAVRYSDERRTSAGFLNLTTPLPHVARSWHAVTPKFSLDYKITPDIMVYGSVGKGFKSGTLLLGSPNPPVNPETVWAYEGGIKSSFFHRGLQANLAVFKNDYKDLQVSRVVGNITVTENAAKATVKGVEFELNALPWSGGRVGGSVAYLDATYASFTTFDPARLELGLIDLSGKHLPYSPTWTASARIEQHINLGGDRSLTANADITWSDRVYHDSFQLKDRSQSPYALLNGRLTYQPTNPHLAVGVWMRNITDKTIHTTTIVSSAIAGFPKLGSLNEPRTFGGDVSVKF